MFEERRESERVRANLPARWEGAFSSSAGTVVDISTSGCFVLSDDSVQPRELIRLEVELPTGRRIYAWGEVVYRFEEVGFALRFTGVDATERRMLEAIIEFARNAAV
jgi:hypothetical protein